MPIILESTSEWRGDPGLYQSNERLVPSPGESPKAISSVVEDFLQSREEILSIALARRSLFEKHHLLKDLEFSSRLLVSEKKSLPTRILSLVFTPGFDFRHDMFSRAVSGLVQSGRTIVKLLDEGSRRRATQLLTWVDNSGGSVVLYAHASLKPRVVPPSKLLCPLKTDEKNMWLQKTKPAVSHQETLPFVAGD
ncbi:MAG: hypothetical protein ACOX7L_09180 [Dethiobacteria bacterium]|jgi:hypothetical protein